MQANPIGKTRQNALSKLPGPDADLRALIAFCRVNDPSPVFMEQWGSEYPDRARELWAASTHAYKAGHPTGHSGNELLLCMAYDVKVAPYIGIPEEISHSYLHAMLRELREKL